jgi:hypothetical protein
VKKIFFLVLLLCASLVQAQTVQVSVNLKNLANAASVSTMRACFSLVDTNQAPINNPRTTTGVIVPNQNQCFAPDGTGLVSTPIIANDQINPPNTMYLVDYQQSGQSITSSCYFFNLADTTENLNTKTSGCIPSSSLPAISTPVLTNPLQSQTITQPSNTNFNVVLSGTGSMTVSGGGGFNLGASTFTGTLGLLNGGTGSSSYTTGGPLYSTGLVISSGAANANGVAYSTGTTVTTTLAGGAGTLVLQETGGGTPSFGSVTPSMFTGQLGIGNGGTGASTFTVGAPLYYNGSVLTNGAANANGIAYSTGTTLTTTSAGGAGTLALQETGGGVPFWNSITDSMFSGQLSVAHGGTGTSTFTTNGVLYGNGTGALQVSNAGGAGTLILTSNNGGAPFWGSGTTGSGTPLISNTANPASAGTIRLASVDVLNFRNNANTGNIAGISKTAGDIVAVGDSLGISTSGPISAGGSVSTNNNTLNTGTATISGGNVLLNNAGNTYQIKNNAGNGNLRAMGNDAGDILSFGTDFNGINIDGGGFIANNAGATPASAGFIRMANGNQMCWNNNAGNANVCLSKDTNDKVNVPNLLVTTGVAQGSGFKHQRFSSLCTVGTSNVADTCDTTLTWTSAFADANYTVVCFSIPAAGLPQSYLISKAAASFVFRTANITASAAHYSEADCVAVHD